MNCVTMDISIIIAINNMDLCQAIQEFVYVNKTIELIIADQTTPIAIQSDMYEYALFIKQSIRSRIDRIHASACYA